MNYYVLLAHDAPEQECFCYWCGKRKIKNLMLTKTVRIGKKCRMQIFCDEQCFKNWALEKAPKIPLSKKPTRRFLSWGKND